MLTSADLNLSAASPDPVAREVEEWNSIRASGNLADLRAFRQRYPNGPHAQAANESIQRLEWDGVDRSNAPALKLYLQNHPQSPHSSEARQLLEQLAKSDKSQIEQSEWDSVDKRSKESLAAFLDKYPNGGHGTGARQLLTDIAKEEKLREEQNSDETAWGLVNKSDRTSIEGYLGRFPSGKHTAQAQQALANVSRGPASQDESASVLPVLNKYAAAWEAKDVDTLLSLQPKLSRRVLKAELAPVRVWRMSLTPVGSPEINGDRATIMCRRRVDQIFSDGTEKKSPETTVTYMLKKQGSSWVIEDVR